MKVLFLCTGNACRSQMAEGFAKQLWPNVNFQSAGIKAHGLDERAVDVMLERKIDISNHTSDIVTSEMLDQLDLLVTVCGDADESCPMVDKQCTRVHWPLQDPAKIVGSKDETLEGFRRIRDEIQAYVVGMGLQKPDHS